MGWHRAFALALAFAGARSMVRADLAQTYPMSRPLNWEVASEMQMSVSAADGDVVPLIYTVIPLTADLGLNESQTDRGQINIQGKLTYADATTYTDISGADVIPYLCCDQLNNSFIQPDEILNQLMSSVPQPAAILLYSQQGQCCGLAGQDLNYQRILTTPDLTTASQVENITMVGGGTALATIAGNFTKRVQENQSNGNNSAVAMSILYSITGLITLLFLIIIGSGAVRAHRYPERYGPRAGFGGRPRQSRAKGLARAVLETLPIVKFGANQQQQQQQPKPDLDIELESGAAPPGEPGQHTADPASHEAPPRSDSQRHLSTIPESPITESAPPRAEVPPDAPRPEDNNAPTTSVKEEATSGVVGGGGGAGANNASRGAGNDEEGLGCSICTDDFSVGEDVRVLPCNHKFHPQCIDPWLVNVSGTCPLCRLDLRPGHDNTARNSEENIDVPPLDAEGNEGGDTSTAYTRRRPRLFDMAGLRHASVEERIEALRRLRAEQDQASTAGHEAEMTGHARLSDRLRERFHIRTRPANQHRAG